MLFGSGQQEKRGTWMHVGGFFLCFSSVDVFFACFLYELLVFKIFENYFLEIVGIIRLNDALSSDFFPFVFWGTSHFFLYFVMLMSMWTVVVFCW